MPAIPIRRGDTRWRISISAGIKPVDCIGQVTLKPLDLSRAAGMMVNAGAGAGGTVHIELLDQNGYRVRGL
jgi:hypothetical protein